MSVNANSDPSPLRGFGMTAVRLFSAEGFAQTVSFILVMQNRHVGAAGRLRFSSNIVAGCSLVRIVEEELVAVGIIDHQ